MNASADAWILGDGGQARETAQLLRVLAESHGSGPRLNLVKMLGAADEHELDRATGALVLGVGFPALRIKLLDRFADRPGLVFPSLVHPRADVGAGTEICPGVVISSGCITTTDVVLGEGTVLNPAVTVGHDSVLGRGCVVNPGANISGAVTVGDGVLIGAGAVILQGLSVGRGATVGAGAVVTKDVQEGVTVVGVPARPIA